MEQFQETKNLAGPYDSSVNLIYHLLFCDNLDLYKNITEPPYKYPFDILFSDTSSTIDLQKITNDSTVASRAKVLAYRKLMANAYKPDKKELLAVIVEIAFDGGLDVLASYRDGTARYINHTGKILIWETGDDTSNGLTNDLFLKSKRIVDQIGPWDQPRRPHPANGNVRITFLVSDGLYFGEAPENTFFNDPLAGPALLAATELMKFIVEKSS